MWRDDHQDKHKSHSHKSLLYSPMKPLPRGKAKGLRVSCIRPYMSGLGFHPLQSLIAPSLLLLHISFCLEDSDPNIHVAHSLESLLQLHLLSETHLTLSLFKLESPPTCPDPLPCFIFLLGSHQHPTYYVFYLCM